MTIVYDKDCKEYKVPHKVDVQGWVDAGYFKSKEDLNEALKLELDAAADAKEKAKKEADAKAKAVRVALEEAANNLEIKFDAKTTNKSLQEQIEATKK